jgi:hypothetical protein
MGYRSGNAQENAQNPISKTVRLLRGLLEKLFWDDWRTKLFALLFALSLFFFLLSEGIV